MDWFSQLLTYQNHSFYLEFVFHSFCFSLICFLVEEARFLILSAQTSACCLSTLRPSVISKSYKEEQLKDKTWSPKSQIHDPLELILIISITHLSIHRVQSFAMTIDFYFLPLYCRNSNVPFQLNSFYFVFILSV